MVAARMAGVKFLVDRRARSGAMVPPTPLMEWHMTQLRRWKISLPRRASPYCAARGSTHNAAAAAATADENRRRRERKAVWGGPPGPQPAPWPAPGAMLVSQSDLQPCRKQIGVKILEGITPLGKAEPSPLGGPGNLSPYGQDKPSVRLTVPRGTAARDHNKASTC